MTLAQKRMARRKKMVVASYLSVMNGEKKVSPTRAMKMIAAKNMYHWTQVRRILIESGDYEPVGAARMRRKRAERRPAAAGTGAGPCGEAQGTVAGPCGEAQGTVAETRKEAAV